MVNPDGYGSYLRWQIWTASKVTKVLSWGTIYRTNSSKRSKKIYKIWISMLPSLDKTEDQIWIHPDFQLKSPTLSSNQVTMFKTSKSEWTPQNKQIRIYLYHELKSIMKSSKLSPKLSPTGYVVQWQERHERHLWEYLWPHPKSQRSSHKTSIRFTVDKFYKNV